MATTEETIINQAISDFDDIEAAITETGVDVPEGTDTKEYGGLIRSIPSLYAGAGTVDQTFNPESENAQSGKAVEEAIAPIKTAVKAGKEFYGNALKATASGEIVRVDDVSPMEHTTKAKISGKNLVNANELVNDFFVKNEDGSFTFTKGANRFTAEIELDKPIPANTLITISVGSYEGTASAVSAQLLSADRTKTYGFSFGLDVLSRTKAVEFEAARFRFYIATSIEDGAYANLTDIQLEIGDTATEYEPYIDPTTLTVTRCGKNLFPYPFNATTTDNGITFTDNGDGSITINGTNNGNGNSVFYITKDTYISLPKGEYIGTPSVSDVSLMGVEKGGGYLALKRAFTVNENTSLRSIYIQVAKGTTTTFNNVTLYPMLERGTKASEYEIYKGETYTPSADGTVEFASVSPTMTVYTDTACAMIDLTYNQDTNKAMENVHADITTLDNDMAEIKGSLGDIDTALDAIIAQQEALIGGDGA